MSSSSVPIEDVCKAWALNIDADVSTPYSPLNPVDKKTNVTRVTFSI